MSLQLLLTQGNSLWLSAGNVSQKITIAFSRITDGYIEADVSISGLSSVTQTITLIFTPYFNTNMEFLFQMVDTLIKTYTKNGRHFGNAVSQTFKHPTLARHILSSTS